MPVFEYQILFKYQIKVKLKNSVDWVNVDDCLFIDIDKAVKCLNEFTRIEKNGSSFKIKNLVYEKTTSKNGIKYCSKI